MEKRYKDILWTQCYFKLDACMINALCCLEHIVSNESFFSLPAPICTVNGRPWRNWKRTHAFNKKSSASETSRHKWSTFSQRFVYHNMLLFVCCSFKVKTGKCIKNNWLKSWNPCGTFCASTSPLNLWLCYRPLSCLHVYYLPKNAWDDVVFLLSRMKTFLIQIILRLIGF